MTINREHLAPCPFCGSRDVEVQGKPAILDALDSVCCNECTADAPYPVWNTRAQAQAAPEAEPVAVVVCDGLLLSAESKAAIYERERMAFRPNEQGRPPEQADSVFAWAYTYGGVREFCSPCEMMDQVRLGLFFGDRDAGPNPGYTDWIPLMTVAQHNRIMASAPQHDAELVELLWQVRKYVRIEDDDELLSRIDAKLATLSAKQ